MGSQFAGAERLSWAQMGQDRGVARGEPVYGACGPNVLDVASKINLWITPLESFNLVCSSTAGSHARDYFPRPIFRQNEAFRITKKSHGRKPWLWKTQFS